MYYKLVQACIYKLGQLFYYKLGQIQTLLQIGGASLLQIGAVVTNRGKIYYKLGKVLQIRVIITNSAIITGIFSRNCKNELLSIKLFKQNFEKNITMLTLQAPTPTKWSNTLKQFVSNSRRIV